MVAVMGEDGAGVELAGAGVLMLENARSVPVSPGTIVNGPCCAAVRLGV